MLIVGATLGRVAYDEYRQTQEFEYRLLEAHARNADEQVVEVLGTVEHLLNKLAVAQSGPTIQDKALAAALDEHRMDIAELGTLLVTDADGHIRAATAATLVGKNVSREPYFSAHLAHGQPPRLFMSRPDKRLLGTTAVVFSRPIIGADHQFRGIVGVTIGHGFFPKVLQAINPDDSASMSVIFNRDGDLLYRREKPEQFFGNNIAKVSQVFREHVLSENRVTRHIGPSAHDGKTRLFLVRDIGNNGLSLILSRRLDEVLATWYRNITVYALIFAFSSVVVVALAIAATRRKQLENARQEALSRIQKIASQVPGVVFQYRLHPDGHASVPYASEAIREIYRVGPEEVREDASRIFAAIHPDDLDGVVASLRQSAQDLTHWHQEYRVKFDDGTVRWLLGNALPQREADGAVLWHGFITDITERKQMEADIIAAKQQAEDANLAKSKFIAAASHDLRQPLHAQGLFLSVLARTELNPHQREMLVNATAASRTSSALLNALLDFSRVEAGAIHPRLQTVPLQPLLNKLEREFEPQADAKGIAYRSRETDLVVQSDPILLERILRNLVSNAIRYTGEGGVLVACRKRGDQAMLEVWDTGIGIAPEHRQEIFREFHQLGNPERDQRKGLGLGLAIVEGLAHTLGHRLTLASTLHRGSVFRIALPIAPLSAPVKQLASEHGDIQLFNLRVLVIDDDETVRQGMLHLLRDWGCECVATESIEEALALARSHAPDLVISDYRLRERRTGLEAIAALRELLGDTLPALLITGDTEPNRSSEAQADGISMLHKPVSSSQLYRAFVTILPH